MAPSPDRQVALLSIHPQYAFPILEGTKQVELRKTGLRDGTTHVAIYATRPVMRVVGLFEVAGVEKGEPARLWQRYGPVAGIARDDFDAYFGDRAVGYAINARRPRTLTRPVPVTSLEPHLRPPQSLLYLDETAIDRLWSLLPRRNLSVSAVAGMMASGLRLGKGIVERVAVRRQELRPRPYTSSRS